MGRFSFADRFSVASPGDNPPYGAACFVVAAVYTIGYLAHPDLPGHKAEWPLGWWGWWDQSNYLQSARAFAAFEFDPTRHWYFPGYSLVAAPFGFMNEHHFFVPNLLLVLVGCLCFLAIARRFGVPHWISLIGMGLGLCPAWLVFQQYIVPWNTTLTMAALMIASLAYVRSISDGASVLDGIGLGAAAGVLMLTKPTDILAIAPMLLHLLVVELIRLRRGERPVGNVVRAVAACALVGLAILAAGAALYLSIYGFTRSPYLVNQAGFSLVPAMIPFRFYVMFLSPQEFFGGGVGIVPQMPWVGVGLIGTIFVAVWRPRFIGLYLGVATCISIYLSYPDWTPHNVWRFLLIHYIVWPLLMMSLFAVVMIVELIRAYSLPKLITVLLPLVLAVSLKLQAVEMSSTVRQRDETSIEAEWPEARKIFGARLTATSAPWSALVDWKQFIEIGGRRLRNFEDYRLIPTGGSIYFVFNTPIKAASMKVSFPGEAVVSPDATLLPVRGVVRLRPLRDWSPSGVDPFIP